MWKEQGDTSHRLINMRRSRVACRTTSATRRTFKLGRRSTRRRAVQPRGARDPGQPAQADCDEHDLTHIPYRPWCEACVKGKAKRKPSRRICGAYSHSCNPRVRMDYGKLTEVEVEVSEEATEDAATEPAAEGDSLTMLVMQESQHASVWSYLVEKKGATETWPSTQILEDLETVGL